MIKCCSRVPGLAGGYPVKYPAAEVPLLEPLLQASPVPRRIACDSIRL